MKTTFTARTWVFFTWLLMTGCSKNFSEENENLVSPPAPVVSKLQSLYERTLQENSRAGFIPGQGIPEWTKAIFSAEENSYIIPVSLNAGKMNGKFNVQKFLRMAAGKQFAGEYFYVVAAKNTPALDAADAVRTIRFAQAKKELATGLPAVVRSPLLTHTGKIENGIRPKTISEAGKRDGAVSTGPDTGNLLPQACDGGTMVQIDWYYQEYDNYGNVIYEEYVFSTWECWQTGGGGGGGSNACSGATPQNILSAGGPVSITQSTQLIESLPSERKFKRLWIFHVQPIMYPMNMSSILYFKSEDLAIQRFAGNRWKWQALNHLQHFKEGFSFGIVVNLASLSSVGVVGSGPTANGAAMHLSYTIEMSLFCSGSPASHSALYNSSNVWLLGYEATPTSA